MVDILAPAERRVTWVLLLNEISLSAVGLPHAGVALRIFEQDLIQNRQAIQDNHRLPLFIFGRRPHLIRRKIHGDATAPIGDRTEVQQVPIDSELAAADAEEAAEVDNSGTWLCVPIDYHVDDSTHILVRAAADLLAENSPDILAVQRDSRRRTGDSDGGWGLYSPLYSLLS
jgi:hypothetical protein